MNILTLIDIIFSFLLLKISLFLSKTNEYSSDYPYAKKISLNYSHNAKAALFITFKAFKSFGFSNEFS